MNTKHKISWMALRYSNELENKQLQVGISFIMGCIVVGALIYKNYLLGVVVLIAAILMYQIKKRETPYTHIDIDHNGISVGNELVLFDKISAFYIDQYDEESYLLYRLKNTFMGSKKIIVIEPEIDIDELKTFLLKSLPEKELKQSNIDKIINSF